jgi:hypothetical protein
MKQPAIILILPMLAVMLAAASATAQGVERAEHTSIVTHVMKGVALDPTTYAPAIVTWQATRLDWQTSQTFFNNGWYEHNYRYTVSGARDGVAISNAAGNSQILRDSIAVLQLSLVNNVSTHLLEGLLMPRYPNHRKLLRAAGWIERSVLASYGAYQLSAGHFHQWQKNVQDAKALGFD